MNYDDFMELVRARRSVRRFADRTVSRDDLRRLLEAARWAPSNHNRQPWKFLVIENRPVMRALAERIKESLATRLQSLPAVASAYTDDFAQHATVFAQAPVLVVVLHKKPTSLSATLLAGLAHPDLVSGEPLSVAMAVQNLVLAAKTLGLGTCIMTAPLVAQEAVAARLDLPAGFDLNCFVAVGQPAEFPEAPRRKSLEQIAEFTDDESGIGGKHDDKK